MRSFQVRSGLVGVHFGTGEGGECYRALKCCSPKEVPKAEFQMLSPGTLGQFVALILEVVSVWCPSLLFLGGRSVC